MYSQTFYKKLDRAKIADKIKDQGFNPLFISDPPGTTYPTHSHPETKLLAFISGRMEVRVRDERYHCSVGDRLIIPGNVEHSAVVGQGGCEFYWSEKLI